MFSFHREQSEKIMPRATARIQSDLRSKSIKRRGVYLPFYTRDEKLCPSGRGFSSKFARKRGFEREAVPKTIVLGTASKML